jgi:hypothetical protein
MAARRPDGATATIRHTPRFVTEDMVALRLAALRGVGVCQFPTFVVQDDIKTGRMIDLLPGWAPRPASFMPPFPRGEDCCRQYERSWTFSQRSMLRSKEWMAEQVGIEINKAANRGRKNRGGTMPIGKDHLGKTASCRNTVAPSSRYAR